jgi:hypothetical protein
MKFDDHFLSWVLIYAILAYVSESLLGFFNINNYFLILLFVGFVIALGSWVSYSTLYRNKFRLNVWFIVWTVTHSLSYWLIGLFLSIFAISAQFLYYLFFGFVFHLLTWFIKYKLYGKFKVKNKSSKLFLIVLGLVIILFFVSSTSINTDSYNNQTVSEDSSLLSKLKNLFNFVDLSPNSCPQIGVPMLLNTELGYYITNTNNIEQLQDGWRISVYNIAEMFGIKTSYVSCHKGNTEGENPNYFYCDSGGLAGGIPYLSKTSMNSDGTIGKTTEKSFINIYNGNNEFVKTICGKPPGEIAEEEFKQSMREMDEFFSLD